MKLAVTGKGGVGKTTFCTLLSYVLKKRGRDVIAIDADPNTNLAATFGYQQADRIEPLVSLKALIEERTGVKPGTIGGMFQLNPFVEDIPEKYSVEIDGIRVLVAGAVKRGGSGCYCPENALVRALISHLLVERDTALVLDMEAGIEHLSRGTVAAVDRLLVIVDPARRSIETAHRIRKLAGDLGLRAISVVGNRIRSDSDRELLRQTLPDMEIAGFIPWDAAIQGAEIAGRAPYGVSASVDRAVEEVADFLEQTSKVDSVKETP